MRNAVGYIVTIVAALCWGASGVSADYLMTGHGIELTLISFCRMFTAGVLTIASALARSRGITPVHRELVTSARNWRTLVVYALFDLAACQISYMEVIRASNAGTGTVLQYLGLILIVVGRPRDRVTPDSPDKAHPGSGNDQAVADDELCAVGCDEARR